jgi:hypothetical protein
MGKLQNGKILSRQVQQSTKNLQTMRTILVPNTYQTEVKTNTKMILYPTVSLKKPLTIFAPIIPLEELLNVENAN